MSLSQNSSSIDDVDEIILGSILSRKSWTNSIQRHLPFNNRWKDRFFVIKKSEILSIISSGKRLNLCINRMTVEIHHYSTEGANVLALAYYAENNNGNTNINHDNEHDYISNDKHNSSNSSNNNSNIHTAHSNIKELEIQLQFQGKTELNKCKDMLTNAINKQAEINEKLMEIKLKSISSYLKKKLHIQVMAVLYLVVCLHV